jgi:hypothetical protein
MDDVLIRAALSEAEGWIVGGAIRDERLGRPIVDVDVACREPREAAKRYAAAVGGAVFPLSEQHGAWRVATGRQETVDFTPLPGTIEDDLSARDFTFNAVAVPVGSEEPLDPHGGLADLDRGIVRAVSDTVFERDPLRLLRAVRFEDDLGFHMDERTEDLVRAGADLVGRPAGERILAELDRLSANGFRRLYELGLLEPLGGSLDGRLDELDDARFRLTAVFGENLKRYPISNDLRRYATTLLRARPPENGERRAIHRFRRATEPWAVDALVFIGRSDLARAVEESRRAEPAEPLVRGDELGLPPGPEIGRILAIIDEERAVGTISTREEALELARSLARRQ